MYTQYELARRKSLVSLARLGRTSGYTAGLNGTHDEVTGKDKEKLTYCDNRVDERIQLLEQSSIDSIQSIALRNIGWSEDKCAGLFQGFRNSYCGLLENNSLDFSERSYNELFFAESVNYSAELDKYIVKFVEYSHMKWDAKPEPRNPVLRESWKSLSERLKSFIGKK